jgi:ABC-type nitrate/sulfonate/bicarbonate transport system substrate-binding protein
MAPKDDFCDDFDRERTRSAVGAQAMNRISRRTLVAGVPLLLATQAMPARAAEKLRVSKAVPFAWTFTPLDVGMQMGLFAKEGLDIEASASAGDAKMQQAITAGSIDIGIGSGPGMAFMA